VVSGRSRGRRITNHSAFTLIEIMIVVGIMAVIMAIAIPSIYQQMHKDAMRQAVSDLSEACGQARARAILNGVSTEVRIRPRERSISVIESATRPASTGNSSYSFQGDELVEHRAGGGAIFSATLSEHVLIDYIEVNTETALQELGEVTCLFYPNGTCDEMGIVLRSDKGEVRKLTTEVVTGMLDWEISR
jgi:prepilin-type N-terminal cleavage/methylation domain-containing protein